MTDDAPACPACDVQAQESAVGWTCPECGDLVMTLDTRGNSDG